MTFQLHLHFYDNFNRISMSSSKSTKMILRSGQCLGMIVEGGYMFSMDPDMSNFPYITWHCPKYRADGCPASFVTKVMVSHFAASFVLISLKYVGDQS